MLAVLAVVFLLAVFTRFAFPNFSRLLGDKVNAVTNYRAAFEVLGEGISGERKFSEAFSEAWSLAFHPSKTQGGDSAPAFAEDDSVPGNEGSSGIAVPGTGSSGEGPISDAAAEFSDAVSAGAYLNPDAYAGYGTAGGSI